MRWEARRYFLLFFLAAFLTGFFATFLTFFAGICSLLGTSIRRRWTCLNGQLRSRLARRDHHRQGSDTCFSPSRDVGTRMDRDVIPGPVDRHFTIRHQP